MNSVAFMRNLRYTELYFYKGGIERRMEKSRKQFIGIVLIMVFMIALTRGLTISHNMELHADERVFFTAAQSLKGYISGSSPVYEEVKEYPEGAIVLQVPFHILTAIISRLAGADISPRLSGRIAAVFYFTVGAVLGCVIIYRFFGYKKLPIAIYGLIIVFSLFHEEQSRYGTGDAISLFLLMAIILLAASALTSKRNRIFSLYLSFTVTGMLAAVKYSLIFFSAIPIYASAKFLNGKTATEKAGIILISAFSLYVGFAILSPKVALDPMYIYRASARELDAYLGSPQKITITRIWSHFMSVFTYAMLYSGFPLMPPVFAAEIVSHHKKGRSSDSIDTLFFTVIPLLIIIFVIYNLFVQLIILRSFYPFFFLTDIYVAVYIAHLVEKRGAARLVSLVLCAIMVLRGAYLMSLLSTKNDSDMLSQIVASAVDEDWSKTTFLSGFLILPTGYFDYKNVQVINISDKRFSNATSMELEEGELFLNGARDFALHPFLCGFLPAAYERSEAVDTWNTFKEVNAQYYVGTLYPKYIYYIFGFWIRGSSGTSHEFPTNYVYYR